jgi:hypothetical protein
MLERFNQNIYKDLDESLNLNNTIISRVEEQNQEDITLKEVVNPIESEQVIIKKLN